MQPRARTHSAFPRGNFAQVETRSRVPQLPIMFNYVNLQSTENKRLSRNVLHICALSSPTRSEGGVHFPLSRTATFTLSEASAR